ncbi:MAG: hypothetical protein ACP5KV_07595, partial [Candidatus Methanomethylicaceae archaeon]
NRHLVASWNIAKDGARHVPADCWQMRRVAEELVAPAKLSVEPEKFPCKLVCSLLRNFRTVVCWVKG